VSFTGPHYPFYAPKPYWDLYDDSDIELPELREGEPSGDHATVDWVRKTMHLEEPVDRDAALRATHATLGRITMLDDYLAKILAELENQGMAEDTIVLYTSDHGDMMGEHGLWFKCTHYDGSSRVPFAIRGPGVATARRKEPISLLDLGPTLCGLTGVEPVGPASSGRDMSDLVRGERQDEAGEAIVEYYGDGTRRGWRMIRSGDVKLTYAPEAGPLMFDLAEDPDERHNVADDPEYAAERERLLARITAGWDPDDCDRRRYESEDRRIAIREAIGTGEPADWAYISPPVPPPGTGHAARKR
jgi:choline-sulfatase